MGPLLRIITLCISIIMSLLLIIMIITYYYVFETGQLAEARWGPNVLGQGPQYPILDLRPEPPPQ